MSTLIVKVCKIDKALPHGNADALESSLPDVLGSRQGAGSQDARMWVSIQEVEGIRLQI